MSTPALASRRLGVFRALAGNRALRRVVGGYALFTLTEYSVWIAMLVYAYSRGGATIAGVVALAQLVPAALLAPVFAGQADRRSPVVLLAGGYLVQAAAMGATAAAITGGVPLAAYAAAVVASTAVTATRPSQSTLIPSLAATPDQLTAANVVVSWVEATGIAVAGSLTGVLIWAGGVAAVFAVCAASWRRSRAPGVQAAGPGAGRPATEHAPTIAAGLGASVRLAVRQPRLRLMLALLTAEAAVAGALDLLFVILAVTVLGRSQAWAGYLNSAYGVGAVLAATVSVFLVGRRLGAPILGAALLLSGALAALAVSLGLAGTRGPADGRRGEPCPAGRRQPVAAAAQRPGPVTGSGVRASRRAHHGRARDRRGAGAGAGAPGRQPARAARRRRRAAAGRRRRRSRRVADLHRQAQRDALARAARQGRRPHERQSRHRVPRLPVVARRVLTALGAHT